MAQAVTARPQTIVRLEAAVRAATIARLLTDVQQITVIRTTTIGRLRNDFLLLLKEKNDTLTYCRAMSNDVYFKQIIFNYNF